MKLQTATIRELQRETITKRAQHKHIPSERVKELAQLCRRTQENTNLRAHFHAQQLTIEEVVTAIILYLDEAHLAQQGNT